MAKKKTRLFIHRVKLQVGNAHGLQKPVHDDSCYGYGRHVTGLGTVGHHAAIKKAGIFVSEANSIVGAASKAQMVMAPGPSDDRCESQEEHHDWQQSDVATNTS